MMAVDNAQESRAVCPYFVDRVSFQGFHWIHCCLGETATDVAFEDPESRDRYYRAFCCCEPERCHVRERRCRVCGCTDAAGCPEGCWWVEEDLCSSCEGKGL